MITSCGPRPRLATPYDTIPYHAIPYHTAPHIRWPLSTRTHVARRSSKGVDRNGHSFARNIPHTLVCALVGWSIVLVQVYHKIPTEVLLDGCVRGSREDTLIGRRRLSDRLREPGCVETRLVALRLVGGISAEEFADRLKGYGGQVRVCVSVSHVRVASEFITKIDFLQGDTCG